MAVFDKADSIRPASNGSITVEIPGSWRKDSLFLLLLLTLLALLSYLLLHDLLSGLESSSGGVVASLSFQKNRVERKIGGGVLWSRIGAPDQIYNYDSIRTDDGSQARVKLQNGTEFVLNDASLVTIIVDENKLSVNFEQGELSVVSVAQGAESVEVRSADGTLKLEGGSKATINHGENGLQVDVQEGEAAFEDTEGRNTLLLENQSLQQQPDGVLRVEGTSFRAISPAPSTLELIFEETQQVLFSWLADGFPADRIEISPAQDFSGNTTQSFTLTEPGSFQTALQEGTWFWRISDANGGRKSPASRFTLVREAKPDPLLPEAGSEFVFTENTPLVPLKWRSSENALWYNVEIFSTQEPETPVQSIASQSSSIHIEGLEAGEYFWQAEADFPAFQTKMKGSPGSFRVLRLDLEELPEPEIQLGETAISQYALQNKGFIITWLPVGELTEYRAEISQNGTVLQSTVVKRTYLALPRELEIGEYELSITALSGEIGLSSQSREFSIKKFGQLRLLVPENGSHYLNTNEYLYFRWHDSNIGNLYLLEVAQDPGFGDLLVQKETDKPALSAPMFEAGRYYSRVNLLDKNRDILIRSAVSSFQVERQLKEAPILSGPVVSGSVDLKIYGSLRFFWTEIEGAEFYRLTITPSLLPTEARTWDVIGVSKEETDVLGLPLGFYSYSLTAFATIRGEVLPISKTNSGNFVLERSLVQKVTGIEIL